MGRPGTLVLAGEKSQLAGGRRRQACQSRLTALGVGRPSWHSKLLLERLVSGKHRPQQLSEGESVPVMQMGLIIQSSWRWPGSWRQPAEAGQELESSPICHWSSRAREPQFPISAGPSGQALTQPWEAVRMPGWPTSRSRLTSSKLVANPVLACWEICGPQCCDSCPESHPRGKASPRPHGPPSGYLLDCTASSYLIWYTLRSH